MEQRIKPDKVKASISIDDKTIQVGSEAVPSKEAEGSEEELLDRADELAEKSIFPEEELSDDCEQ